MNYWFRTLLRCQNLDKTSFRHQNYYYYFYQRVERFATQRLQLLHYKSSTREFCKNPDRKISLTFNKIIFLLWTFVSRLESPFAFWKTNGCSFHEALSSIEIAKVKDRYKKSSWKKNWPSIRNVLSYLVCNAVLRHAAQAHLSWKRLQSQKMTIPKMHFFSNDSRIPKKSAHEWVI